MKKEHTKKLSREEKQRRREEKRAERLLTREKRRAERIVAPPSILTPREKYLLEKRRRFWLMFLGRCGIALLLYMGMMLAIAAFIFVGIWTTKRPQTAIIASQINVEDDEKHDRLNVVMENGVPYVGISFLNAYGEIIHSGDYAARTLRFTDSGDRATFRINSAFCTINNIDVNLGSPVLLREGELYLPLSFFSNYVTGINVSVEGTNYQFSASNTALGYKIKPSAITNNIPESAAGSLLEFTTKTPEFISDLSAYERYMNPGETTEYLTLVNHTHGIAETYRPNDLTGVEDQHAAYPGGEYHAKLRLYAAKSLDAMIQEARANGFSGLHATSGYRTYAEQRYRFNTLVSSIVSSTGASQAAAEAEAMTTVHKPGYSEYQTGLCADVRFPNDPIDTFKDTDAAKWLAENCYKFGFVLRYPESKTDHTGMEYQSWHFRYVGRYHAVRMTFLDMSLEEYCVFMGLNESDF